MPCGHQRRKRWIVKTLRNLPANVAKRDGLQMGRRRLHAQIVEENTMGYTTRKHCKLSQIDAMEIRRRWCHVKMIETDRSLTDNRIGPSDGDLTSPESERIVIIACDETDYVTLPES